MTDLAHHAASIGPEVEEYARADDGCRLWTVSSGTSAAPTFGFHAAAGIMPGDPAAGAGAIASAAASANAVRRARHARPPSAGGTATSGGAHAAPPPRHGFVLCHGGPGFWDTLAPIAATIHLARPEAGPVVRWDQRGGGRSGHQGPYTVARVVQDLETVRRHHGLNEVTVVGHSWGATLALRYAMTYPSRVRQLVYVAGAGLSWDWYEEFASRHKQAMAPVAARMAQIKALDKPTRDDEREADALRLSIEFTDQTTARAHADDQVTPYFEGDEQAAVSLRDEWRSWNEQEQIERCKALGTPTLIIDGALDLRPRWAVDSLATALPNATRVTLHRSGHFPWIDEPDAFAIALAGHLR